MAFQPSYGLITDVEELRSLVQDIVAAGKPTGFDIETGYEGESREKASLHPEENFIAGISFTNSLRWARYVPLRHDAGTNLGNGAVAEIFWPLFAARDSEGKPLGVAHGAVFELRCLSRWFMQHLGEHPALRSNFHPVFGEGIRKTAGYFKVRSCTLLESFAEGEQPRHGLKDITARPRELGGFGHVMTELEDLFPDLTRKQKKQMRFSVLDQHDPKIIDYACEDSLWCLANHLKRYPKVKDTFIYKLEMAVLEEATCEMADNGIFYDWNMMREGASRAKEFGELYKAEVLTAFSERAGKPVAINLNSPPQLAKLMFEDCGMPVIRLTKGGKSGAKKPSTDGKLVLPILAKKYPEVQKLRNHRGLEKLRGTYLSVYEKTFSYAADGRAHPNTMQHGTITGRTSADDPAYQQSPKKYHYELSDGRTFDFNFRDCIMASPGWYIIGFDLAQAELRAVAGLAREMAMFEAFERNKDVHRLTASLIYGKLFEDVTDEERAVGKTLGLALVYQLSAQGLADRLGITIEQAENLFAQFHAAYPRIKEWTEATIRQSKQDGFVTTWFARKVRIWEYDSPYRNVRNEGERTAGNAPVQGSIADYMKTSIVRAQRALKRTGLHDKVRLFMNVHDALYWYARKDVNPEDIIRLLDPEVAWHVEGWPPMVAEWNIGERWGSMAEVELVEGGGLRLKKKDEEEVRGEVTGDEDDEMAAPRVPVHDYGKPERSEGDEEAAAAVVAAPGRSLVLAGLAARGGVAGVGDSPRMVIIEVSAPPEPEAARALAQALKDLPGTNTVVLRMPRGDATVSFPSGLTPVHEPEVSVMLGGAAVYYDEASVDLAELGRGVERWM